MDASPVQSGSKCSSDFSIERILRSDSRGGRSDNGEVPDWLCCTRYQPPRLQRAVNGGSCRGRRAGRHARVPFTGAQAAALEAAYARAPYLAPPALRALAAALQLRDDRIKIWFQNRRARERREKCTVIAPPVAVTLPATTRAPSATLSHWTLGAFEPSQQFNYNVPQEITEHQEERSLNERNARLSFSSTSPNESTDDERPDTPLDIETVEDSD